jgi:dCMP deaminase
VAKRDNLYLDIAGRVALESHALRAKGGAVLVRDDNILSMGYNGMPSGMDNCCEITAPIVDYGEEPITVTRPEVLHAESNALAKIARSTQTSEGSTMYVTLSPCMECAKLMVQAGVKRVVYRDQYRDLSSITFLKQNNIEVEQIA